MENFQNHMNIHFQDPNVEELALELLEHTCVIGNNIVFP